MNRRQAFKTAFSTVAAVSALYPERLLSQQPEAKHTASEMKTLHLNPATGRDTNSGAKDKPIRTLGEAARRVNQSSETGAMTLILSEGVYPITEPIVLKGAGRSFSKTERLTLRAEILPDDPEWNTGRMPTLIHAMSPDGTWNGRRDPLGGAVNGMQVETSHVTIRGLKILGMPVIETPKADLKRRLYGIARLGSLDDLEVAQCLFLSDQAIASMHVGIIARGTGVNIHHCIFHGYTKDAVVYWEGRSTGHAMRNCIFHGMYGSTVWASGIADDFDYRNNVVDSCNYVWIYQGIASARTDEAGGRATLSGKTKTENRYKAVNSLFAHNKKLAGTGTGARIEFKDIDPAFLEMVGTKVTAEPVAFEHDPIQRNYLHPVANSEASKIGAGLFLK